MTTSLRLEQTSGGGYINVCVGARLQFLYSNADTSKSVIRIRKTTVSTLYFTNRQSELKRMNEEIVFQMVINTDQKRDIALSYVNDRSRVRFPQACPPPPTNQEGFAKMPTYQ